MDETKLEDGLERQIFRGLTHTHARLSENFANLYEVAGAALALAEVLVEKGILDQDELNAKIVEVRERLEGTRYGSGTGFIVTGKGGDKYAPVHEVDVDCDKRWHLCKAACCTLGIALSKQDLAEGVVKWDPGEPYLIRRGEGAHCCHVQENFHCEVREHRPLICRRYNCKEDPRIWDDYDNYVPNAESIADLLSKKDMGRLISMELDARDPDQK